MGFSADRLLLYAVTDRAWVGEGTLYEQIEQALIGGATLIQLREKCLNKDAFIDEAVTVKKLCQRYNVPLIINDNLEVAISSGADGVHVGMGDCPVAEIRKNVGKNFIIGATAKTVEQAIAAQASGADYLGVGAVFASPTKSNAIRITSEQLKLICKSVSIPAVAIGGINEQNMSELAGCGIRGIAVVSSLFSASDIKAQAERLKSKVRSIISAN